MIKAVQTELKGLLKIELDAFEDHRGCFIETYNRNLYARAGIDVDFVQDDISISRRNVLRGIHGDDCTYKLISCIHGRIFFAVVNCDRASNDFGKSQSFVLTEDKPEQILIPPNFGNAHLVLSDTAIFQYKQSCYYDRSRQFSYRYDEPEFAIDWPVDNPILSERDSTTPYI